MNIPVISDLLKGISDNIKGWNDGRVRIKEAKINAEVARYNAQAEIAKQVQQQEGDWDIEALKASQNSWKDEWLTLLLSFPFIGAFIPVVQDYVLIGFKYLDSTPGWYQMSFLGIVAASFGLRWWFKAKK